jgi:hypothetical protein
MPYKPTVYPKKKKKKEKEKNFAGAVTALLQQL